MRNNLSRYLLISAVSLFVFFAFQIQSVYAGAVPPDMDPTDMEPPDTEEPPEEFPCEECDGKVTQLTLQYNGLQAALIEVEQEKGDVIIFSNIVEPGGEFTFEGQDKKGTLGKEINIFVDGVLNTEIHTSCSKPIGPGLISGDFEVVEGFSLKGSLQLCPAEL